MLAEHGLDGVARVLDAPLRPVNIDGEDYQWYALPQDLFERPIDLLFVDGPAGPLAPMVRYPALPLLEDRLADGALFVVDDSDREREARNVARWLEGIPGLRVCQTQRKREGFTRLRLCKCKPRPA